MCYVYRENEKLSSQNSRLTSKLEAKAAAPGSAASRIQEWLRKDEISEAYEIDATYDGTIGKEALIFREAMLNFYDDAKIDLDVDFNERKLVKKLHKALTGDARQN